MRKLFCFALLATSLALVAGCGPSGPKLVQISGTVKFKGEPVPAGYIAFLPPSGTGSQCVIQIKDGIFDSNEMQGTKGVHPGANKVTIAGFNGKTEKFYGQGKQIFNPVSEEFTVPGDKSTKDFVVPESAGKNVKIEPTSDD